MAGEDGGAPTDPYASLKANLRDTIKWLAGVFAALAAVVIAGTPLSGLAAPNLDLLHWVIGAVAIGVAFGSIVAALVLMLQLLRSDLIYPSDIDPNVPLNGRKDSRELERVRNDVAAHQSDLYPQSPNFAAFLAEIERANQSAQTLGSEWQKLEAHRTQNAAPADAARAKYDDQVKQIQLFRRMQGNVLAFASYQRLYTRLQQATPWLLGYGALALAALLALTFAIQPPKEDKSPTVVVVPIVSTPSPAPAPTPTVALDTVYFDTNSADISAKSRSAIQHARDALLAAPDTAILLLAHTDTVGPYPANVTLARRRADAVRKLLTNAGGIATTRVFAAAMPKTDLPEITREKYDSATNRAVTMYLIPFHR